MKSFVTSLCVLAAIIAGFTVYDTIQMNQLVEMTEAVEQAEKPDLTPVKEKWSQIEGWLSMFVHHNEVEQIDVALARMDVLLNSGSWQNFLAESAEFKLLVQSLHQKENPVPSNIL